jgi:hypothetical protein
MAGAGITGRDGDAKIGSVQICEVTKWNWVPKQNIVSYASNKTAGYKHRQAGIKEGQGTLEGVWDPANPAYTVIPEGTASLALKLYITATQFWAITGIIEQFTMDVPIDAGELVTWSATFYSQGIWTAPVSAFMLDESSLPPDAMPMQSPDAPVFGMAGPPRNDGETDGAYAARTQAFLHEIRFPGNVEEVIRRVTEKALIRTTQDWHSIMERAAEKAALKLCEGMESVITDNVMKRLAEAGKAPAATAV